MIDEVNDDGFAFDDYHHFMSWGKLGRILDELATLIGKGDLKLPNAKETDVCVLSCAAMILRRPTDKPDASGSIGGVGGDYFPKSGGDGGAYHDS